jgi:predicted metal-dependent phosphoesterase TrpH
MRIDTHVHTSNWSDGVDPVDALIEVAKARKLGGLIITDHNRLLSPAEQQDLNRRFPGFHVFRGAEVSVGDEHVLVIGGADFSAHYRAPDEAGELARAVTASGAFSVLAHPWWRHKRELEFSLDAFCPDAIDVMSLNADTSRLRESLQLARTRRMRLICGSDAHSVEHVGVFHIDTEREVSTDEELVEELRQGRYRLRADRALLKARKNEVREQEATADRVIARGGSLEDFRAEGGLHGCFYERRLAGGSYYPPSGVIGKRG